MIFLLNNTVRASLWYILPTALLLILLLIDITHSFDPTDDGFILGYAWRILRGERAYLDFLYVRPPGSPIFWSLFVSILPNTYLFLSCRALVVVQLLTPALIAWYCFKDTYHKESLFVLCMTYFIISLHSFPIMAWHTVDGVFFSYLALLMLINTNARGPWAYLQNFLFGACLVAISLTKQNFAIVAAIFGVLFALKNVRSLTRISLCALGAVSTLLGVGWWLGLAGIQAMLQQLSAASNSKDLVSAGFYEYMAPDTIKVVLALLCISLLFIELRIRRGAVRGIFFVALPCLLLWARTLFDIFRFGQVVFLYISCVSIWLICRNHWKLLDRSTVFILGSALISWTSSISWGWKTPLLGSAGFSIAIAALLSFDRITRIVIPLVFLGTTSVIFYHRYATPYRDVAIWEQSSDLGTVFPAMHGIKTDQRKHAKFREMDLLYTKFSRAHLSQVALLPSTSFYWPATQRGNPLPIDWLLSVEYAGSESRVLTSLGPPINFIILDQDYAPGCAPLYLSAEVVRSLNDFTLKKKRSFWCVFRRNSVPLIRRSKRKQRSESLSSS